MSMVYENITLIIALICVVGALVFLAYKFMLLPSSERNTKILAYLLNAVTLAEKDLGSGTGVLKLVSVYAMFIKAYPVISKIMPYVTFEDLVKDALVTMRELINNNKKVAEVIVTERVIQNEQNITELQ